jgi:hypothetical protein
MMDEVSAAIAAPGFTAMRGFNQVREDNSVEFIIGCHSVGAWGHGIGPSMAFFNPGRLKYEMRPTEPVLPRASRTRRSRSGREEAADSAGG